MGVCDVLRGHWNPIGHGVQAVDPGREYEPGEHGVGVAEGSEQE